MLFMVDFIWGTHHFAAQHYGVLRLYENVYEKKSTSFSKNEDKQEGPGPLSSSRSQFSIKFPPILSSGDLL